VQNVDISGQYKGDEMREVKVRAWDKMFNKFWFPQGASVLGLYCGDFDKSYFDGKCDDARNFIWCQFTGLKDKSGVEICEGDIIKINEHTFSPMNFVVEWCEVNHCWWLSSIKKDYCECSVQNYSFSELNGFESDSEIIGNRFENPELLEEKNERS